MSRLRGFAITCVAVLAAASTARAEFVGGVAPESFSVCESAMDSTGRPRPECEGGDLRFQFDGANPMGSEFGFAVAAGFLNGDDRVDLVVGDPRRNRVYIFFGRPSALVTYELDPNDLADRMVSADAKADVILTRTPNFPGQVKSFGFSVAVSSERVTASGCGPTDTAAALLVGAPGMPGTNGNDPGTVFHVPAGRLCMAPSDPPAPLVADPTAMGGSSFQSPEGAQDDEFGYSVAFGRLLTNTGSDPDIIVGARGADKGAGGIFIVAVDGGVVDLMPANRVKIEGNSKDGLGETLAVGDLDADFDPNSLTRGNLDDLAAGAVGHEKGKVLVVQGPLAPTDGRDSDGILREGIDPQIRSIVGEMPGDFFGFSLAVSAEGSLAVGAVFADNNPPSQQSSSGGDALTNVASGARFNAGKVYVWGEDVVGAVGTDTPASSAETVFVARRSGDQLGFSVAYGDFDGSGADDLAMAARREDGRGLRVDEIDQGTVYVVYDSSSPTSPVDLNQCDVASDCTGVSSVDVLIFGGDRSGDLGDEIGFSLAAGNFNDDKSSDLFVSSLNHHRVYAVTLEDTDADRSTQGRNLRDDDDDNDGEPDSTDCAPITSTVNPGAMEIQCNAIDENCNGMADDAPDADGDGYDVCNDTSPGDLDDNPADCADADPASHPGALEVCDGNDNDCSGGVPSVETDADGDHYAGCSPWADTQGDNPTIIGGGDCDRQDPATFPGSAPNEATPTACMRDRDGDDFGDAVPPVGITPGTDCDDVSPGAAATFPGAAPLDTPPTACMKDADGDGFGDVAVPPGVTRGTDCHDADPGTHPGAVEICDGNDNDCSGSALPEEVDTDGDGWVACATWTDPQGDNPTILGGGDCAPTEASTFPGAAPNEAVPGACMMDADGDDYGALSPPAGATPGTDCDDAEAAAFPGAAEIEAPLNCMKDSDDDGYGDDAVMLPVVPGGDCDDAEPSAFPGASESPDDGIDQDCSGTDTITCFVDDDGDGYGSTATTLSPDGSCAEPGESAVDTDCDDTDLGVSPGATEITNDGIDQDCNGADTITCFLDADGDGHGTMAGTQVLAPDGSCDASDQESATADDCDDADPASYPSAPESCDGNDNACAGAVPADEIDLDGDNYVACGPWVDTQTDDPGILGGGDCDPASDFTFPGAAPNEVFAAACMRDEDGDGYGDLTPPMGVTRGSDCDDDSVAGAFTFPGAAEIEGPQNCMRDVDEDGYGDSSAALPVVRGTDCDDAEALTHPGAMELCDGNDNACTGTVPADETDPDGDLFVACSGWSDIQGDQPSILGGDDCAPTDPAAFPGASPNEAVPTACTQDEDGDGFGDDSPPMGVTPGTDCDDDSASAASTFPGAAQIEAPLNCMKDSDDDGYGDSTTTLPVVPGSDCDDAEPTIFDGAPEILGDGIDQDCNGFDSVTCIVDIDMDSHGTILGTVTVATDGSCDASQQEAVTADDCDDADPTIFPGAAETLGDGIDQDCNGFDSVACVVDIDMDTHGTALGTITVATDGSCDTSQQEAVTADDCDDADPASHPGAAEICDGNDNVCAGSVPTDEIDGDMDGFVPCLGWSDPQGDNPTIVAGGDCDDVEPTTFPGAPEICGDTIDSDCDGMDPVCPPAPPKGQTSKSPRGRGHKRTKRTARGLVTEPAEPGVGLVYQTCSEPSEREENGDGSAARGSKRSATANQPRSGKMAPTARPASPCDEPQAAGKRPAPNDSEESSP